MVTQHYRWDFIGLSSYDKPTPDTSEKVVDGSTYYEADTSKLYVFYNDTWYEKTATGGGGGGDITVVQTTGDSTTDVMSQNATSSMVFPMPTNKEVIGIGTGTNGRTQSTAVGGYARVGNQGVSIGYMSGDGITKQSYITNIGCLAGRNPSSGQKGSVSLGAYSKATMTGEVNVGSTDTSCGYNSTNYRIISGVHDGQNAHDAVTVNQVNSLIDNLNSALSTNIPHIGA